jgi:hypothetical protein
MLNNQHRAIFADALDEFTGMIAFFTGNPGNRLDE